jgi:sugar transferase EpsL
LVGVALAVVAAVIHSLLGYEVRAWIPYLSRWLVRSAARRLPSQERSRYEQDWLGNVAAWNDRPLAALAKAFHIRLKVRGIRESVLGVSLRGERLMRAVDIGISLVVLLAITPAMLVVALLVRIDTQERALKRYVALGRDGKKFRLYRFPEVLAFEPQPHEPKPAKILRLLDWFSAAPELLNVLRGDMSLVGPLALSVSESPNSEIGKIVELEGDLLTRAAVRPGVICPAENDPRLDLRSRPANLDESLERIEEMFRRDAAYVRSRSFLSDLRVLVCSPVRLLPRARTAKR